MVLSSTPYHHLEYYPRHNVIVSQWYGSCTSQEYRSTLTNFLRMVEELGVSYAIADRRLLPPIPIEDIRWTVQEYTVPFSKLPLKRFAFINSFDPTAEKQLQQFVANNGPVSFPFEVNVFEDLTSAYEWLTATETL